MIRVLVVDDQQLVRAGIAMLLKRKEDIEVIAEAVDGRDALIQARAKRPDVILMDVRMPQIDGIEATSIVVNEGLIAQSGQPIRIIILTTYHDEAVYGALRVGASGFLLKDALSTEIVSAIRAVAAGKAWLDPTVTRGLIDQFASQPEQQAVIPARMSKLTQREREILILMAQGVSNSDIAKKLEISEATVKTHLANLMKKLEVQEKLQAVIAAYQTGLVRIPISSVNLPQ
jgi:RNA polymerase sigma factor (sigma-70 family)